MKIFCSNAPHEAHEQFPRTGRIASRFETFAAAEEIDNYLDHQCGQMIVAGKYCGFAGVKSAPPPPPPPYQPPEVHIAVVCAGAPIREKVEDATRPKIGDDLRLVSLSLEPAAQWTGDEIANGSRQETSQNLRIVPERSPGIFSRASWLAFSCGRSQLIPLFPSFGGSSGKGSAPLTSNSPSDHERFVRLRLAQGARAR